ncbi:MAG TPA: glutamate-5-semialdehyde dehydrogenase [Acidimicrobiales bacterium]
MTTLADLGARARAAAVELAAAPTSAKSSGLSAAADLLAQHEAEILHANADDVERAEASGTSATLVDRLRLDPARVAAMADGLRQVAALPDPVGEVVDGWVRPNGLRIRRVRVPLGVIGVIYESRPNVTSDAAGLCVKSGNAAFLRGSSAAIRSNIAVAAALREGLAKAGLPEDAVVLVEDTSRESATEFMRLRGIIDCLVPRGGPSLIAAILEHATVPYVIDGDGNCHVYVDESADLDMASTIVVNAKTQRPGVCNAAESLLVHAAVATDFLPKVAEAMPEVRLLGDRRARSILPRIEAATDEDFSKEFLDHVMSVAVVGSIEEAIAHIRRHGTGHTEAIVTRDLAASERFARDVDAAVVMVNASTRFTDGEQFGFGAEIGNSTQKLHARGPMGLRELTAVKYIVHGDGHVRH